jgi:endogenous inhibitor of DNA gyrase (YacG/DUF329 family)
MSKRKVKYSCPGCGKPAKIEDPAFPFCSDRCRTLDLANWADGKYVISTPLTAADLMGDADYTIGAVERVPASSVKPDRQQSQAKPGRIEHEDEKSANEQGSEAPLKAQRTARSTELKPGQRKEGHGRRRG